MYHRKPYRYRVTEEAADRENDLLYIIMIVFVCSVLSAGCGDTPVEESGERIMQIYLPGNGLIAEAEEEHAAYYGDGVDAGRTEKYGQQKDTVL